MMKYFSVALLATYTHARILAADQKCVELNPTTSVWSLVTSAQTKSECSGGDQQWILAFKQNGYPDHHPSSKTWWMKRVADTEEADTDAHDRHYFSGPLSVRDIKFTYEAGVDAVLNVDATGDAQLIGIQPMATMTEAEATFKEASSLYHAIARDVDDNECTSEYLDEVEKFMDFALSNTGGPVLVTSGGTGLKALSTQLLFRARKRLPRGTTLASVQDALNHGYTLKDCVIEAIANEAGESKPDVPVLVASAKEVADASLQAYPWLKYLYNVGPIGVFDAGQPQVYHVQALKVANIKSIIQMRIGDAIREPVNLQNLVGGGPSRGITLVPPSGTDSWVAANGAAQIYADAEARPASWACQFPATITWQAYTPCVQNTVRNFETENPLEWGDASGLNIGNEGVEMEAAGIKYYHLPVGLASSPPVAFDDDAFLMYAQRFLDAFEHARRSDGHVLFHCTIGYRTGAFPTALLGLLTRGCKAQYNQHTRGITTGANDPGLTQDQLNLMMHSWGYDVKDKATGHRFENGTNVLFDNLAKLEYKGTCDWTTGRLDGTIEKVLTPSPTPSPTPTPSTDSAASVAASAMVVVAFAAVVSQMF